MKISKFGEHLINKKQWYKQVSKDKIITNETMIDKLWQLWVVREGSIKRIEKKEVVFYFNPPIEI